MESRFLHDVFLSHHPHDGRQMKELAEKLHDAGLQVWFQDWFIRPGEEAAAAIEQGLERSRVLVLCLSPAALKSEWVALERRTVRFRDPARAERRFVPLLLADVEVPESLRRYQHIDYRHRQETAFEELVRFCRPLPAAVSGRSRSAPEPPPGGPLARFERRLSGHRFWAGGLAWSPDGAWAASGARDKTVKLWDLGDGTCRKTLAGHTDYVSSVAITPDGTRILSASEDRTLRLWDASSGELLTSLAGHKKKVLAVAALPDGVHAISGGFDGSLIVWNLLRGTKERASPPGPAVPIFCLAADRAGERLVSGHEDGSIRLWDLEKLQCRQILSGHSLIVQSIVFSADGRFVVSGSNDKTIKVWDLEAGGRCVDSLESHGNYVLSLALSPAADLLASAGYADRTVRIWDRKSAECLQILELEGENPVSVAFDPEGSRLLVGTAPAGHLHLYRLVAGEQVAPAEQTCNYVNAKVVLLGESQVGKTTLAHRLIEDRFVESVPTHGMNVWPLDLPLSPDSSLEREALLWDLAGQEEYRLIHRLFLDETALALLLIDSGGEDPWPQATDWLATLEAALAGSPAQRPVPRILVFSQSDRGERPIDFEMIRARYGFAEWLRTSAKTGENCSDAQNGSRPSPLKQLIASHIRWPTLHRTTTPWLVREIKRAVLALRDLADLRLIRFPELLQRIERLFPSDRFGAGEVRTAISLLANHLLVKPLHFGDLILLRPDLLNAYAGAIVRAARHHPEGIGCVAELDLYGPSFDFSRIERLERSDEELLLRAVVQMLLDKSLCVAEDTPIGRHLVFPSQYLRQEEFPRAPEILVSFSFLGDWQTIWTTLIVHLTCCREFKRRRLWRNAAEFETGRRAEMGIRIDRGSGGEPSTLGIFFDANASAERQAILIRYVHWHLEKHGREVRRDRRYACGGCGAQVADLEAVRKSVLAGEELIGCVSCGEPIPLFDFIEKRVGSPQVRSAILSIERSARRMLDGQALEQLLMGHMMALAAEANQIFRPLSLFDFGIDGELEFKDDDGQASGRKIYLQLKSGNSYLKFRKKDRAEVFYPKNERHLTYWANQPVDVFLVFRQIDDRTGEATIKWMNVTAWLRARPAGRGRAIVFAGEQVTPEEIWKVRDFYLAPRRAS